MHSWVEELSSMGSERQLSDLPTQMTLNWKPRFNSFFSIWDVMLSKPTWLLGAMVLAGMAAISEVGSGG